MSGRPGNDGHEPPTKGGRGGRMSFPDPRAHVSGFREPAKRARSPGGDRPDRGYTAKRKRSISPSFTTYSFPSERMAP
jgi:hypothetical protein